MFIPIFELLKIDYRKYSHHNKGYKYILVIIDAFSRFAYTVPLKFKTAEESAKAIDSVFDEFMDVPIFFSSDKGNEQGFRNYLNRSLRSTIQNLV